MIKRPFFVATAMTLLLLPVMAAAAQSNTPKSSTKSYRWVDSQGVTHYGDHVPPEYSSQGKSELNSQGVPVREYPRQLSPAEAVVAQQSASDEARRRQHDSFLLTTYLQVSDIEQLRDERLALIEGQMEIARGSIASSDQRMVTLKTRMANFQPYSNSPNARRVPDQLAEEVVRAINERRGLQAALISREKEKTELRDQFNADIARYRELTARPAR
ncbi:MAG: DUF4124 domain-containing protein [Steroidobacteraceae bacterium]